MFFKPLAHIENFLKPKKKPSKLVMAVNIGAMDVANNKITHVLVKHNEFAIYEIDTPNINNRIRTVIDGYTDESEQKIQDRFNKVKQDYIQAIGLLSNSPNTEMLKRRIAHTLSTCLSGSEVDGNKEFKNLIKIIKEEHEKLVRNRLVYLTPVFLSTLICLVVAFFIYPNGVQKLDLFGYRVFLILSILIGASISILINTTKLNFEEYSLKKYYLLLGLERVFLALVTGISAFICLKSGLIFPSFFKDNVWEMFAVLIVAGFSESLIPSFLTKIESNNSK